MSLRRRDFITWTAGGAFLLASDARALGGTPAPGLSPWIRIAADGRVTLISTVSEMGQGSRTGQIQILADELDVAWDAIRVEMAPDEAPFQLEGDLETGGSEAIRTRYEILRKAGATARAQLTAAAARRWGVSEAECAAALGRVSHKASGRSASYGELAGAAATIAPPADPPLKPASERRHVGRSLKTLGLADKVTGKATAKGSAIGLEFQILDDLRHPDAKLGRDGDRTIGSLYDLIPAPKDKKVLPIGEWNHARILSQGRHVEFWLNGAKTVEFERGSPEFRAAVDRSKFKNIPDFGEWADGHILLQEHGSEAAFRNVKIRELPAN